VSDPQLMLVTIRALPDDAPAAVRLRRWLKLGLRTFGLRCVSVEEVPPRVLAVANNERDPPMGLESNHVGQPGVCRSCGARIQWVETVAGRRMPLDVGAASDGNVIFSSEGKALVLSQDAAAQARQTGATRFFRSHFATCPDREKWRRK
jgi:hypothetical protein